MGRLGIGRKLQVSIAGTAVLAVTVAAAVGYLISRAALEDAALARLTSVREMKAEQAEAYFSSIRSQAAAMVHHPGTVAAMRDFAAAYGRVAARGALSAEDEIRLARHYDEEFIPRLGENTPDVAATNVFIPVADAARRLQMAYIVDSPFGVGSKHLLDASGRLTEYDAVHARHHPFFRDYLERFGYYDIFLIDAASGSIVYSVYKEVDFATSLRTGPYRSSNLAKAFAFATDEAAPEQPLLVDFEPYAPSYDGQASFIAIPIDDGEERIGVLAFQMPVEAINEIMTSRQRWPDVGLGATGETYIVAADLTLRTEPRGLVEDPRAHGQRLRSVGVPEATVRAIERQESAIGLQRVPTEAATRGLDGDAFAGISENALGDRVLAAARPLDIDDVNWTIVAEIETDEAFAQSSAMARQFLLLLAVLLPLVMLVARQVSRSLTGPISLLAAEADQIAGGDLHAAISVAGTDEIGDLARRFVSMRDSIASLVERQERAIEALSTPIIPFGDDMIVLPLVGEMDEARMTRLRTELAEAIHNSGALSVAIDLTGVPDLGPEVASQLARSVRSARLLGAQVVLTGMRPELARTIADLGAEFAGVEAARTLELGLARLKSHDNPGSKDR